MPDVGEHDTGTVVEAVPLAGSLVILAAVVVLALVGLGLQGNWPKVLRVSLASVTYVTVVVLGLRAQAPTPAALPFLPFALAGAAAGLVSGLVRPTIDPGLVVASTVAAAVLLGGFHWFSLTTWRHVAALAIGLHLVQGALSSLT